TTRSRCSARRWGAGRRGVCDSRKSATVTRTRGGPRVTGDKEQAMANESLATVLERLNAVKDTMTVSRVFGDAYERDGVTVIPVASVRGGGGGGGGEGEADDARGSGSGGGVGFGVTARPVGVYVVKDGEVSWQPSV